MPIKIKKRESTKNPARKNIGKTKKDSPVKKPKTKKTKAKPDILTKTIGEKKITASQTRPEDPTEPWLSLDGVLHLARIDLLELDKLRTSEEYLRTEAQAKLHHAAELEATTALQIRDLRTEASKLLQQATVIRGSREDLIKSHYNKKYDCDFGNTHGYDSLTGKISKVR